MKKFFLLSFTTLLFTNTLFVADNSVTSQSLTDRVKTNYHVKGISPTGVWFTEDDELP